MNSPNRIDHQPAFLLSTTPWRESSLLIDIYSKNYGKQTLIARSARKRQSELRGILVPFVPLSLSWYGKENLKNLHRAQWIGGWPQPQNQALMSALYLNEITLKLTTPNEPNPYLYQALYQAQQTIATQKNHSHTIRCYEWQLLQSEGLAPSLSQDDQQQPIIKSAYYLLQAQQPPHKIEHIPHQPNGIILQGQALLSLEQGIIEPQAQQAIRLLTRTLIQHALPEPSILHSRQIQQQIQSLQKIWRQP